MYEGQTRQTALFIARDQLLPDIVIWTLLEPIGAKWVQLVQKMKKALRQIVLSA